jgi:hypothetical protein
MKDRDRAVVDFALCSFRLCKTCYADHLRAVPINTKKSREVLPLLNPSRFQPSSSFEVPYEF